MKKKKYILIFIILFKIILLKAQNIDIFSNYSLKETYFPYYNLWDIEIKKQIPAEHYYFVLMELLDEQNNILMISRTQAFALSNLSSPYNILYNKNLTGNFEYEWKDENFYRTVQKTGGFLPEGNYEIKYSLFSTTQGCNWAGEMLFSKIFYLNIYTFNLLDLISPFNKDTIIGKYPTFVWLPLSPEIENENITYTIKVVQVNENSTPEESINTNLPFYEEKNLITTSKIYPLSARTLEPAKKYAWMVTAYLNEKTVAFSPVYSFYVANEQKQEKKNILSPFYIELKPQTPPQYINVKNESLYISYYLNENNQGNLKYSIKNNETGKVFLNGKISPLIVGQGENLYLIDISRLPDNKEYQLTITGAENSDIRTLFFYLKRE